MPVRQCSVIQNNPKILLDIESQPAMENTDVSWAIPSKNSVACFPVLVISSVKSNNGTCQTWASSTMVLLVLKLHDLLYSTINRMTWWYYIWMYIWFIWSMNWCYIIHSRFWHFRSVPGSWPPFGLSHLMSLGMAVATMSSHRLVPHPS